MKKRIVCILLTLIMLVSLVPAAALNAAAASNAISESAIYVLKQLQEYKLSNTCNGTFIGYGTKCPDINEKDHSADNCDVFMYEYQADAALREELAKLDTAVNSFASRIGRSFTQSQHDALVLFSYANGTAWTLGTGAFQTAIKSGYTGSQFLDAICKWNTGTGDDERRMVEANMYLNGVYSAAKPSRFICVTFDVVDEDHASLSVDKTQYYDVVSPVTITVVPTTTAKDTTFQGWYTEPTGGVRVTTLTSKYHGDTLYALWQSDDTVLGRYDETGVSYTIKKSALSSTTVYNTPNGDKVTKYINHEDKEVAIKLEDTLNVTADYIDSKGVHWARIVDVYTTENGDIVRFIGWVKVKSASTTGSSSSSSMDVTVTVTNTYVNMRKNAGVGSTQVGSCKQGEQLRIINTKSVSTDSFLWGEVADSDGNTRGWVALQYTDYDSVVASMSSGTVTKGNVIATATITYNGGYVNVRSEAGINNQIVGALSYGVTVDLYQVKYVNSVLWGLTDMGWFCLSYANVSNLSVNSSNTSAEGYSNFVFEVYNADWIGQKLSDVFFKAPNGEAVEDVMLKRDDGSEYEKTLTSGTLVVSNLVDMGSDDEWGKTSYGWIPLTTDVTLQPAKFYVIVDTLTVRDAASADGNRVDVLLKGTEFDVVKIDVVGSDITGVNNTIWGYADKFGEIEKTYGGWVNLANDNVSRNGAPQVSIGGSGSTAAATVKMAKVVGTDRLRVRISGSVSAKQLGTLSYGTTAAVLEEKNGWYNLDIDVDNDPSTGSWVSGQYLEFYEATVGGSDTTTSGTASETGMGIVANTYTGVKIRTAPGTGSAAVGKYMVGTTVEILETRVHGTTKWGRTDKGWVCMDYIVMTDIFTSTGTGSGSTTTNTEVAIYTGYAAADDVKVYRSTDLNDAVVRTLNTGDAITLHELLVVQKTEETDADEKDEGATTTITKTTEYWARVNDGYIFAPGDGNITLDTLDEHVYTLAKNAPLYDDFDGDEIEDVVLKQGETVVVTKLGIAKGNVWGKVERATNNQEGWTKMSYMTKGFASSVETEEEKTEEESTGTESSAPTTVVGSVGNANSGTVGATATAYTGKVIRTNSVNVRATASTSATVTTTLKSGAALNIYETVISEGMAWGRCDAGWVYLYYVDLTPVGNGAVDAKVVYTENTPIYSDMNMTTPTGSTYARMAVVNIYEVVGKMNRTDLGWVHSDNLG